MSFRHVARRFQAEGFEALAADGSWEASALRGKVSVTDRFLSNFNRPLRRRMLTHAPDAVLPASRTVRQLSTGDVYLIGQTRHDSRRGRHYNALSVLHLVTDEPGGSAGLATLNRRAPIGPAEDPGWLVEQALGTVYTDSEFRSSSEEDGTFEHRVGSHFLHFARPVELQLRDTVQLHGRYYRITDHYADSGFTLARADQEPDDRVDLVLRVQGESRYDRALARYVTTDRDYNVTGILTKRHDYQATNADSQDYIEVAVEHAHIGIVPKPDMMISLDGRDYRIRYVDVPANTTQYRLRAY